jgi:hypothetical protein
MVVMGRHGTSSVSVWPRRAELASTPPTPTQAEKTISGVGP